MFPSLGLSASKSIASKGRGCPTWISLASLDLTAEAAVATCAVGACSFRDGAKVFLCLGPEVLAGQGMSVKIAANL